MSVQQIPWPVIISTSNSHRHHRHQLMSVPQIPWHGIISTSNRHRHHHHQLMSVPQIPWHGIILASKIRHHPQQRLRPPPPFPTRLVFRKPLTFPAVFHPASQCRRRRRLHHPPRRLFCNKWRQTMPRFTRWVSTMLQHRRRRRIIPLLILLHLTQNP